MDRWVDAADRVLVSSNAQNAVSTEYFRREPLGGSASTPHHSRDPSFDRKNNNIET